MGKLYGRVALVTGGSDGIGFGIAQLFIAEGAHVFITGRRQALLQEAAEKLDASGMVTTVQADASKMEDLDKIYEEIRQKKGHLDIIVCSAACTDSSPLESITEQHYDDVFNTNVKGVIFLVQKLLPILNESGAIVLIGSVASTKTLPAFSVYSGSKSALQAFARCWSVDLKERKIRVNVVSPGPINTVRHNELPDDIKTTVRSMLVINRVGEVEDVARAVLFLASNEDSGYITGIELFVDGGTAVL